MHAKTSAYMPIFLNNFYKINFFSKFPSFLNSPSPLTLAHTPAPLPLKTSSPPRSISQLFPHSLESPHKISNNSPVRLSRKAASKLLSPEMEFPSFSSILLSLQCLVRRSTLCKHRKRNNPSPASNKRRRSWRKFELTFSDFCRRCSERRESNFRWRSASEALLMSRPTCFSVELSQNNEQKMIFFV